MGMGGLSNHAPMGTCVVRFPREEMLDLDAEGVAEVARRDNGYHHRLRAERLPHDRLRDGLGENCLRVVPLKVEQQALEMVQRHRPWNRPGGCLI